MPTKQDESFVRMTVGAANKPLAAELLDPDWYRLLFERSPSMSRIVDLDGTIIDCNRVYTKALGYSSKNEVIGTSIFDSVPENKLEDAMKIFDLWKKTGSLYNIELILKRKDGSVFPAIINSVGIYDEMGTLMAANSIIINASDISTTRIMLEGAISKLTLKEKELQRLNNELKGIERAKEEFVSMISHELKTPLVPIRGYSEMLLKPKLLGEINEKQRKAIEIIRASGEKLNVLIQDVLDVYKLGMGKMRFNSVPISVDSLANQVLVELNSILAEKGIEVKLEITANGTVECDPARINQVLSNLLKNSIDFVPSNGGKILLQIHENNCVGTKEIQNNRLGEVLFSVIDNGPGVPSDKLDKLFMKFYQLDSGYSRKHGGTGLGLSICAGIIEAHGGKIWYDPSLNGACFRFVLPKFNKASKETQVVS